MNSIVKASSPSYSTVKQWVSEFKKDCTSISDKLCLEYTVEVITPKMIERIHKIVIEASRLKVTNMAKTTGIVTERVHNILHIYLSMQKLS